MKLPSIKTFLNNQALLVCLIVAILIAIPLKNSYISIATIAFVCYALVTYKKSNFHFNPILFIPILYFGLMLLSLLWTDSFQDSLFGLQKQAPFLFIPAAFLVIPQFNRHNLYKIFRFFSFGMVFFASFYLIRALYNYTNCQEISVFFNNKLVSDEPGSIYISVFASFALFYFIAIKTKTYLETTAIVIVLLLILLLSSKSIITIDLVIITLYYAFFAEIPSGTKIITLFSITIFLFFSIFYVKEVKDKFISESETAFTDNILNRNLKNKNDATTFIPSTVTVYEAWNNATFKTTDFFPGTALRVYQARIFYEMLSEKAIFFTGFGLEATQNQIRKKAVEHQLSEENSAYNFHNQYIQTFAELGVFGFLLVVLMVVVTFVKGAQSKDFIHIAFAISMIMLFLSESFFCRQRGIIFFILLFCLFNSPAREESK